ncbi:unnamed protein product [Allacma fusca]|uniref:FYVE-type domain-containing protein n=1 Tax=Allacma fusca TaxID=39272 RepID=A0A8J2Q6T2_9HEXA|nr:unnamed protein product [Allacma fusca]
MSCHGCSGAFGFLNRERGCPQCGFAYCKKCLRFKAQVEGKSLNVCKRCYEISNAGASGNKLERSLSFTEAVHVIKAMNRLESLENPARPPIVLYSEDAKPDVESLRVGLSPQDQALVDRLANLRNSQNNRRKSGDPAEDIAQRLAHLRGEDPEAAASLRKMNPLLMSNRKQETDDDLLERVSREADMDQRYKENLTTDIEERLRRLRGETINPPTSGELGSSDAMDVAPHDEDELTEEQQVQKIIDRFKAEVEIEKTTGVDDDQSCEINLDVSSEEEDLQDDQICRICDARASLSCKECDGDVFCAGCFQEFHREIGEVHKPSKIKIKLIFPFKKNLFYDHAKSLSH